MPIHVAILKPQFLRLILSGHKTVESRLYRTAMPPVSCAQVGQRVYLKESSGPFRAVARIAAVDGHRDLTPAKVAALAKRYNDRVRGDDDYWLTKRHSRFAVFITLTDVQPIDLGPRYDKSMRAWHVLDDQHDLIHDIPLTPGGLRNNYLYIPAALGFTKRADPLQLHLPDGQTVRTDLAPRGHLRWRGWKRYYESCGLRPGDRVRFVALGRRRYRVTFLPALD